MKFPIHDLYIETLAPVDADNWRSLEAYAFDDHLLKRVDSIEIFEVNAGGSLPIIQRSKADELWTLLKGEAAFDWTDQREGSPTLNAVHSLAAVTPVRVLVPFGVEFRVSALSDCTFLRITSQASKLGQTHSRD